MGGTTVWKRGGILAAYALWLVLTDPDGRPVRGELLGYVDRLPKLGVLPQPGWIAALPSGTLVGGTSRATAWGAACDLIEHLRRKGVVVS